MVESTFAFDELMITIETITMLTISAGIVIVLTITPIGVLLYRPLLLTGLQMHLRFSGCHGDTLPVHIAWAEDRHLPIKIRYFIDWIRVLFNTG